MFRPPPFRLALPTLTALLLTALACAPPATETPAEPEGTREVKQYTIQEFLGTTSYFGTSFSPDKTKILVSSDESGVYNAYAMPVDGSEAIRLTDSEDAVLVRGYFPNDERFLFESDQGGNELDHVYVRELDGTTTDLTPGDKLKGSFSGWAQDDQSFFVSTNERDPKYFDLYEYNAEDYSRELIFENNEGYSVGGVSPDKRYVALSKTHTRLNSDLYLYDRENAKLEHLSPHEGEINFSPADFSPDGKSLYIMTDENSDFLYLVRHDLETGERETVEKPNWDVNFAYFSKNGKYFIVGINNDARTQLKIYQADTMTPVDLPELEGAEITSLGISRDESLMAFYASSSRTPRDLFVQSLGGGEEPKQLTRSLNPKIDPEDLVDGEVARFASFDGTEIPGILYKPHQASSESKVPAMVWVHGGPGGQSRIGYNGLLQYLVNHGYALFAINNRGSSGYGRAFESMDNRAHGEGDLDDCVASKTMLAETGWVDGERVGILGGSYGGYMTLAALAFRPDEFDVGVDIVGVSNWVRTLNSIPPWWESFRLSLENEMGDFDDEDYLKSISPLFHADKIRRPLLVLQGANDPRVLKVESDEIVEAVKANGVPVEYIVFEDEGHGFVKKENQEKAYKAILDFLDRYLKEEGDAPEVATPDAVG